MINLVHFLNPCRQGISALLLGFLLLLNPAHAVLEIDITASGSSATPIVIAPFVNQSGIKISEDIAAVVSADLGRTGRFAPIDRSTIQTWGAPQMGQPVAYGDWRKLSVQNLVVGRLQPSELVGFVTLEFEIHDVFRGQVIRAPFTMPAKHGRMRSEAHRLADIIYQMLTGIRGAFDTRIAFIAEQGRRGNKAYQLVVADADGQNGTAVVTRSEPMWSTTWSPDAKQLAYVSSESNRPQVYLLDVARGSTQRVNTKGDLAGAPAFSPDGRWLALYIAEKGNLDIYLYELASQRLRRMTRSPANDLEPTFSPDGKTLVFTSNRGGRPQLYQKAIAGGQVQRLTFAGHSNYSPAFSPDGRLLAMVHRQNGQDRIAVLELASRQLRVITKGRLDEAPSFSPNGEMLIYTSSSRQRGELAAITLDGKVVNWLNVNRSSVREPAWSPFLYPAPLQ